MKSYKTAFILTAIGVILIIITIVVPILFPKFLVSQIDKKLLIKPDSEMLEKFVDSPVPIYFQVYVFNLTNVDEVSQGGKPVFKQLGPYTYFQDRLKVDIGWNNTLGTILFKQKKYYYFNASLSSGLESDLITTINPIFITLSNKLSQGNIPDAIKSIAQLWFMRFNTKAFMTKPIKELLFDGYHEPLLETLYILTKDPAHKAGKFGFFLNRNGTSAGEMEVYTGAKGMSNYQTIRTWHDDYMQKYTESLTFWKEDRCNLIKGTDGAQFPRPISESDSIVLFTAELCRSIYAVFEKDVKHGPLHLKRFILPPKLLEKSDENDCYCSSNFTCRPGMIDISPCKKGAPVIVSTPHFYQGSEVDQKAAIGINPIKEEHETYLDIEPITGVPVRAAKRIQINMPLRNMGNFPSLASVPELIFPILWVNESVEVPMPNTEILHRTLTLPVAIITIGCWILLAVGILCILIAVVIIIKEYKKNNGSIKRQTENDKKVAGNNIALIEKPRMYQVT